MKAIEIKKDIYWVGAKDWNLREFHGYLINKGTTYNSYLIMDEKITLVDGVKNTMTSEQLRRIESLVDFKKIEYLVVNHVENDHSGSIPDIMKLGPQIKIITDLAGKKALEDHYETTGWNFEIVKTGDIINIGVRDLEFMTTPMLHWPDSMMTYIRHDKLLLSNDGFGQHYPADTLWVKDQPFDIVMHEAKHYFANILFPYCPQAKKALATAHDLGMEIETIAPSHGVIWSGEKEVGAIIAAYAAWSSAETENRAVIVYDSMYGATAAMAERIMADFQEQGIPVVKHCLAVTDISDVVTDILGAKYVCIGNPTLNNQLFPRVAKLVTYLKGLKPKNKKAFAFGSYGWMPGVVSQINDLYAELGWQYLECVEAKYTPKEDIFLQLDERVKQLIALD